MLLSLNDLRDTELRALDGPIGRVTDCLFDDDGWTVRYLVVDAVDIADRPVVISPIAVVRLEKDPAILSVAFSRDQIRNSPGLDRHRPVSREYEQAYGDYYGFSPYWIGAGNWGAGAYPRALFRAPGSPRQEPSQRPPVGHDESHLRSTLAMAGYHVWGTDGPIGHVHDLLVDENTWMLEFLRLDPSITIGAPGVLIQRQTLRHLQWSDRSIAAALTVAEVRASPEYDPELLRIDAWRTRLTTTSGRVRGSSGHFVGLGRWQR